MEELIKELKEEIIEALNLEEMTLKILMRTRCAFWRRTGTDLIDAVVELIVLLDKKPWNQVANSQRKAIFKVLPRLQTM